MTLASLIQTHKAAYAIINHDDFEFLPVKESDRHIRAERDAAEAFIRYVPRDLKEVAKKAQYASGKALTMEDKLKALHRMTWC